MNDDKLKEQYQFWQHRWTQEHTSQILVCVVFMVGALAAALWRRIYWMTGVCIALIPLLRVIFYHRMMLYVEKRIYEDTARSETENQN